MSLDKNVQKDSGSGIYYFVKKCKILLQYHISHLLLYQYIRFYSVFEFYFTTRYS